MKKTIYTLFVIVCILVCIVFLLFNFVVIKKNYKDIIVVTSKEYNLKSELVFAIVKVESDFDKNAISKAGARGLMQIMSSTASWIAEKIGEEYSDDKLFEPEFNIKCGCYYLRYLCDKFSDEDAAICAYNAGETAVRGWLDDAGKLDYDKIDYSETKNYIKKVRKYEKLYGLA